jgi:hypothetical protein
MRRLIAGHLVRFRLKTLDGSNLSYLVRRIETVETAEAIVAFALLLQAITARFPELS